MRFAICRYAYVIGLSLSSAAFAQTQPAAETKIQVDATKTRNYTVPRSIFGTFLEPIGNSTYNGLWAELLENPSFEDNPWSAGAIHRMLEREPSLMRSSQMGLPLPWEPLDYAQGARYEARWNDAANS